ncbi:hypothetical protein Q8A73_017610 [Channa argus]|nr:hypothetical protein Q8A73_017610 [Channa argus]
MGSTTFILSAVTTLHTASMFNTGLRHHECMKDNMAHGSVSVNMPEFSIPHVEKMSQVSLMNLSSAGAERSVSYSHKKRSTIRLPDEHHVLSALSTHNMLTFHNDFNMNMNLYIYISSEINHCKIKTPTDTKLHLIIYPVQEFCAFMDVNKWKDSYLNNPSNLIIITISPRYKADTEVSVVDINGLHTKYIDSMNTCVYQWLQDAKSLLLMLLRKERYVPPTGPMELKIIIKPVALISAATL